MPKVAKELGALAVRRIAEPGLHPVGVVPGLALQVTATGARSWILRVMVKGRRRDMGLGGYPAVQLADAHRLAREAREAVSKGIDPVGERRAAKAAGRTFAQCADEYITSHSAGWKSAKSAQQWRNTLTTYVYPGIGSKHVRDVERADVLDVLKPIWETKTETATRVRSRIELVLSYAMQKDYRPEGLNPARWRGGLDKLLPAPNKIAKVEHHPALPVDKMPAPSRPHCAPPKAPAHGRWSSPS